MFDIEKEWIHCGLPCVVIMGHEMGTRCGYVGVFLNHPFYGDEYQDHYDLEVHGGLTYSGGHGYPSELSHWITNPRSLAEIEVPFWWFGYDCAHLHDGRDMDILMKYSPKFAEIHSQFSHPNDVVRSLEYCIAECESLASELTE